MAKRIPWDEYEAAYLLDNCIKVQNGEISHKEAVSRVSKDLRKRAISLGMKIDKTFRNKAGIEMQMHLMEACYLEKPSKLRGFSKLFKEIVAVYKRDRKAFEKILKVSKGKVEKGKENDKNTKKKDQSSGRGFKEWLIKTKKLAKRTARSYVRGLLICEQLAVNLDLTSTEILEVSPDITKKTIRFLSKREEYRRENERQHHRLSAALAKYSEYISSENAITARGWYYSDGREPKFTEQLKQLISCKYKYGFPINDQIALIRLRNFANEKNTKLPEDDKELLLEICAAGMEINNKIRVMSESLFLEVNAMLNDLFKSGIGVVFIEELYEKNSLQLQEYFIESSEILREILKLRNPDYYFGKHIIIPGPKKNETQAIVDEVHRISGDDRIILVDEVKKQLWYVPPDKILGSVSASPEFVRVSEGKYFRMKHFIFDKGEAEAILRFVTRECDNKGYASIKDVPMGNIPVENYELPTASIHNAIYNAILQDKYKLKGKILTKNGGNVNIKALLREFCEGREECTITELMEKARELTGNTQKQNSFAVLYDVMVRVDRERFVSENQIHFDVKKIDEQIKEIVGGGFTPIKRIIISPYYPPCGKTWNRYVLESYCYRFSKKYKLSVPNYNYRNVGLIVAKNLSLKYDDMLCEILAKEKDIELSSQEKVGKYLYKTGLTGKINLNRLPDIIRRAVAIRKEQ